MRNLRHVAVELNRTAPYRPIIELNWTAPYDSGNNRSAHANGSMPVGYHVTAVPVPALSTGALRAGASVLKQSVTSEYVVMEVLQGQLYELRVVVNNSMGFSKEVPGDKILARAVSPPDQPRRVTFVINPLNMTNGTGNRNGSLSWLDPLDVGLGVACAADTLWTGCQAGYPLRIDRYSVQRIKDSGPEDMPLTPQPSNEIQIPVLYASAFYKFQVAAGNLQEAVVGSFSALGAYAESTTGVPLLSGPPLSMRLLYYPWSTNSSQGVGGQTEEAVIDAPQGRGVSDWCFVADGLQCPTDDSDVSVDWEPPANNTCQLCKNPELAVFVNSAYTFKVRAVKAIDIDFAEFYPEEIAFENNLAEALGPAWQSMATLTYSTFRCSGPGPDTHPSDVAACAEVNRTNIDDGRAQWDDWGYGWKEVLVTLTANTELAARGDATELCFTAMTPSNKRSKMCVDVRVIRPDPQFVEFTLEHNVTMGCRFMTDVTAEDRTELSLSRETALEKNYLVDITSSGGRKESRYRSTPFPWLPAGAQLNPKGQTSPTNNSITYRLQWTPKRFQEGFTYILNLEARGFLGDTRVPGVAGTPLRTISLQINGTRMRLCLSLRAPVRASRTSVYGMLLCRHAVEALMLRAGNGERTWAACLLLTRMRAPGLVGGRHQCCDAASVPRRLMTFRSPPWRVSGAPPGYPSGGLPALPCPRVSSHLALCCACHARVSRVAHVSLALCRACHGRVFPLSAPCTRVRTQLLKRINACPGAVGAWMPACGDVYCTCWHPAAGCVSCLVAHGLWRVACCLWQWEPRAGRRRHGPRNYRAAGACPQGSAPPLPCLALL